MRAGTVTVMPRAVTVKTTRTAITHTAGITRENDGAVEIAVGGILATTARITST